MPVPGGYFSSVGQRPPVEPINPSPQGAGCWPSAAQSSLLGHPHRHPQAQVLCSCAAPPPPCGLAPPVRPFDSESESSALEMVRGTVFRGLLRGVASLRAGLRRGGTAFASIGTEQPSSARFTRRRGLFPVCLAHHVLRGFPSAEASRRGSLRSGFRACRPRSTPHPTRQSQFRVGGAHGRQGLTPVWGRVTAALTRQGTLLFPTVLL